MRPAHRAFHVVVTRIRRLTPSFVRVTFGGDDLVDFGTEGFDQRIKVILPLDESGFAHFPADPEWYAAWRALPVERRNPIRTYTARAVRPEAAEIDVDFVAHGDAGPASAWVSSARIGDELVVIGPDARSDRRGVGVEWDPADASTVLLAGDETAAPAIASILEQLDGDAFGSAFIEVPTSADVLDIAGPPGVVVQWLPRRHDSDAPGVSAAPGERLVSAVRDWTTRYLAVAEHHVPAQLPALDEIDLEHEILWEVPRGVERGSELYAWLAGEASAITSLRRFMVAESGIDRRRVAFMGYWRLGKAEC